MRLLCFIFIMFCTTISHAKQYAIIKDSAGKLWQVEIAADAETRAQGLMYRPWLAPWQGMLFIFPSSQETAFWMKHTLVPLDIRFYDEQGQLISRYRNAQPCLVKKCPTYPSNGEVKYVLETSNDSLIAGRIKQIWLPIDLKVK